ncbi:hypothetical protein MNBD_ALPHA11-1838 [hydrothermal vent metagenome]|uniref:Uncharacterized protein n=1 Tax=hydrothermal vent metagenome TaxID=652676 RepID=A0A3B0U054_9ZZZZ
MEKSENITKQTGRKKAPTQKTSSQEAVRSSSVHKCKFIFHNFSEVLSGFFKLVKLLARRNYIVQRP